MSVESRSWVDYTLLDGRADRLPIEAVEHVSVLGDGRGVMYVTSGRVIITRDGGAVLEQWRRARSTEARRISPPECSG